MLKKILLIGTILASFTSLFSQNYNEIYVKEIDTVDLRKHLSILASDDFEGRFTGSVGQKKAARYIEDEFQKIGCAAIGNQFTQSFKLYQDARSGSIYLNKERLSFPADFGFFNLYQTFNFEQSNLVFVNKVDPKQDYSDFYIVMQQKDLYGIDINLEYISCKGFIFILEDYDPRFFSYTLDKLSLGVKDISLPIIYVNQKSLSSSFIKDLKKKKINLKIKGTLNNDPKFVTTENVIGFVEGSDPVLKGEVIVISAHYDHLGSSENEIFYGADDNGSGTAALIELASAFQAAKKDGNQPKRSLLFCAFTGEELGLFGSLYYSENPLIPLKKTVANLNIDMIGRLTRSYENDSLKVLYIIGANRLSLQMDSLIKSANSEFTNLVLDEKYNQPFELENLYYRSDHYNFAKNGIPSCFFFGGFHADYHKATDTIEKISFEKIAQISNLVFHTAWKIADAPKRLLLIK